MALEIVRKIVNGAWATVAADSGGSGAALTVTDGSTTVTDVTELDLSGHTVSELSPGVAEATVSVPVLTATVALNDAQIKALPAAPLELVAAPGVDKMIVPLFAILRCDTTQNGYSNIDAGAGIYLGPEVAETMLTGLVQNESVTGSGKVSHLLAAFADACVIFSAATLAPTIAGVLTTDAYLNTPLNLITDNQASGNFTDGDAANTFSVTVLYMIVDL